MALDGCFKVAGKIVVKRTRRGVFFRQTQRVTALAAQRPEL